MTTNGSSLWLIWLSILFIECSPLSRELRQPSTITKYRLEEEVTRDSGGNSTGNPGFLPGDCPCSDHRSNYSQLICFHPEFQVLKHRDKWGMPFSIMFRHFFPCVLNFRMVSRVRCGTWLYQFLILAFFFFTFFGSDRPKEKSYNSTLQSRQLIIENPNFRSLLEHRHFNIQGNGSVVEF